MKVLLVQLDGKLPNLALMRLSAHHKKLGHEVKLMVAPNRGSLKQATWADGLSEKTDLVYG